METLELKDLSLDDLRDGIGIEGIEEFNINAYKCKEGGSGSDGTSCGQNCSGGGG